MRSPSAPASAARSSLNLALRTCSLLPQYVPVADALFIEAIDSYSANNVLFLFPRSTLPPRELWANSSALSAASPYFRTMFESCFSEAMVRRLSSGLGTRRVNAWREQRASRRASALGRASRGLVTGMTAGRSLETRWRSKRARSRIAPVASTRIRTTRTMRPTLVLPAAHHFISTVSSSTERLIRRTALFSTTSPRTTSLSPIRQPLLLPPQAPLCPDYTWDTARRRARFPSSRLAQVGQRPRAPTRDSLARWKSSRQLCVAAHGDERA